jgi:hypothetical protein
VTLNGKSIKSTEDMVRAQREAQLASMGLQITLGRVLIPALTAVTVFANKVVVGFRRDWPGISKAIGPTVAAVKDVVQALATAGNAVAHFKPLIDGLKATLKGVGQTFTSIGHLIHDVVHGDISGAVHDFGGLIGGMVKILTGWTAPIQHAFKGLFSGFGGAVSSAFSGVLSVLRSGVNAVIDVINLAIKAYDAIPSILRPTGKISPIGKLSAPDNRPSTGAASKSRFATGGAVPGSGSGDTMLGWLTPGEHVLTKAEVQNAGGHSAIYAMRRALGGGGRSLGNAFAAGGAATAGSSRADIIRTVISIGKSMGATPSMLIAALEAGLQESNFNPYSVGDSGKAIGIFQEWPDKGSVATRQDPAASARWWFNYAKGIRGAGTMSPGALAQAVERSANPAAYAPHFAQASSLLATYGGGGTLAVGATSAAGRGRLATRGITPSVKSQTAAHALKVAAQAKVDSARSKILDFYELAYQTALYKGDMNTRNQAISGAIAYEKNRLASAVASGNLNGITAAQNDLGTWTQRYADVVAPSGLADTSLTSSAPSSTDSGSSLLDEVKALRAAVDLQNHRADAASGIEANVLKKAITDVVTGQIGGTAFRAMQTPGSTGQLASY